LIFEQLLAQGRSYALLMQLHWHPQPHYFEFESSFFCPFNKSCYACIQTPQWHRVRQN